MIASTAARLRQAQGGRSQVRLVTGDHSRPRLGEFEGTHKERGANVEELRAARKGDSTVGACRSVVAKVVILAYGIRGSYCQGKK